MGKLRGRERLLKRESVLVWDIEENFIDFSYMLYFGIDNRKRIRRLDFEVGR